MSGHSKWSQIKRKKGIADQARGNLFSKLSRIITLAVLEGGGITDPDNNVKLRLAVEKAKQSNMPKENVLRAIERGVGPNKAMIKEVVYEVFAQEGVSLIILATSDNVNRTLSDIKNILERNGAKLAGQGSVDYLFQKCGLVTFHKSNTSEEKVLNFAERLMAQDIDQDNELYYVYIPFEALGHVKDNLNGLVPDVVELDYRPKAKIEVKTSSDAKKILNLVDSLEELDDVHKVFGNFDIPDETIQSLA